MKLIKRGKNLKPYYETKLGKLYHGDCLEIIPGLETADLVLTDPPYDKNTHKGAYRYSTRSKVSKTEKMGIKEFPYLKNKDQDKLVNLLIDISKGWIIIFCSLEMLGSYQKIMPNKYVRGGIWDRITNTPQLSGDRPAQGGEAIAIFHYSRKT